MAKTSKPQTSRPLVSRPASPKPGKLSTHGAGNDSGSRPKK